MTGLIRKLRQSRPLRSLRRQLREIEYHSARRPSTRWSRMSDIAFFTAPVLAVAVTVWMHHAAIRSDADELTILRLGTSLHGEPIALIVTESGEPGWPARPFGEIDLLVLGARTGFPFFTRTEPGALRITFARPLPAAPPDPLADPGMRRAATSAIDLAGSMLLQTHWHGEARARTHWLAIAGNVGIWWFVLLLSMTLLIQFARFGTWLVNESRRLRHQQRRSRGKCPSCGYDTRANVWSERCPECGAVLD